IKVLAPGFYAQQNVRTPVKIGLLVLVVTQLLNLVLVPQFAHAGLALSISLGAWVNAGLLLSGLMRRGVYRPRPGWIRLAAQVFAATLAMAGLLAATVWRFDWIAMRDTPMLRIGAALGLVALAGAIYLAVLLIAGIRPRQFLRRSSDG
ncbi:MAG TPA: lipid II flippase MurJ, partial [Quisquiliibacterium sp.]|nr:lipid II flippase MurJ [Quisquiliibacterium sp.]